MSHWTRRAVVTLAAASAIALAPVSAAFASVEVSPTSAAAGATVDITFAVTNDRTSGNTTRVEVALPESSGVTQADVSSLPGWSATQTRDGDDQLSGISWSKGEIAPGATENFLVTVTLPADRDSLPFTVTQAFSDGTVVRYPDESETAGPAIAIAGGATTTTPSTTTTVAPSAATTEPKKSKSPIGNYLIGFGVLVVLFLYMRTKASLKRSGRR